MCVARVVQLSQRARPCPGQAGFAGACIGMHAAWTRPARAAGAMGPSPGGRHQEMIMTLKIYPIVLQLVRRLSPYLPALRARSASLGDQLERALISVPLNLAEGAYSPGVSARSIIATANSILVLKTTSTLFRSAEPNTPAA